MSLPSPSIHATDLTKRFGRIVALDGLDLRISGGELHCLLGRNGAGKTTLMRSIMGLTRPSRGDVRINGVSVLSPQYPEALRRVGFLAEEPVLYPHLTGREFLEFVAGLYGLSRAVVGKIDRRIEAFGLSENADVPIRTYSLGSKKKLGFIASNIHDPLVLVLDEPLSALDAAAARAVKDQLVASRECGHVVFFSTHVMEIAERLADRLTILRRGRIAFDGTIERLRSDEGRASHPGESLESIFLRVTARDE